MILPQVLEYSNLNNYFKDLLRINKSANTKYSQRYLAKKLEWPVSLMNDIACHRKVLSINRCVEFIVFNQFEREQMEHFLYLCIRDSTGDELKSFVDYIYQNHKNAK